MILSKIATDLLNKLDESDADTETESKNKYQNETEKYEDTTKRKIDSKKHDFIHENRKRYSRICERLHYPQISIYIENIAKPDLKLAYRGIGAKAVTGIAYSLKHNTYITNIDLTDNSLNTIGTQSISKVFYDNFYIKRLNLSCNRIGNEGLTTLLEALTFNGVIEHLNVSENGLTDKCGVALQNFLCRNTSLRELVFNQNNLCTNSGLNLRTGIEANSTLEFLDLSWNQLRSEAAIEISKSFSKNIALRKVLLAWNGFSDIGAEHIGKSLAINNSIEELDISNNRITDIGCKIIAEGLLENTTLKKLYLGWNPIKYAGVNSILDVYLDETTSLTINAIHLEAIFINEENRRKMDIILKTKPNTKIVIGGYAKEDLNQNDEDSIRRELLNILRHYLHEHRLRMVDLFNQWDKDKSFSITRDEFRKGVRSCKIPFTETQLKILIEWLDNDGSDSIEYPEFVSITEVE